MSINNPFAKGNLMDIDIKETFDDMWSALDDKPDAYMLEVFEGITVGMTAFKTMFKTEKTFMDSPVPLQMAFATAALAMLEKAAKRGLFAFGAGFCFYIMWLMTMIMKKPDVKKHIEKCFDEKRNELFGGSMMA